MANRYWVGGTGNWDASLTTNWSTTSGGSGGASAPTSADNVFFDVNSNVGTGSFSVGLVAATCADLTVSGLDGAMTFAFAASMSIYGSLNVQLTNVSRSGGSNFGINFLATTTGKTISCPSNLPSTVTFNGVGGGWTLLTPLALSGSTGFSLTAGSVDLNGQTITCSATFSITGTATRSLTLGAATISVTNSGTAWNANTTTGLTFNAGTSQINVSGVSSQTSFVGGGLTYYNVSFTGTTLVSGASSITGSNTFNNLTIAGPNVSQAYDFTLSQGTTQTINGTLTFNSNSANATQRLTIRSGAIGTTSTLSCAAIAAMSDVDFRDIAITGAASPLSGTRLGDCGGNTGITFGAGVNKYWNLSAGGNWNATAWATSSGGTVNINNFPLAQDTCIFNNTGLSISGKTISVNSQYYLGTVDFSALTNATTISSGSNLILLTGSWVGSSAVTVSFLSSIYLSGRNTTQNITCAGQSFNIGIIFETIGTTVSLQDTFLSTSGISQTYGTFLTNNNTVTCASFTSSNSNTRTITLGTSTINLSGTGTVWTTTTITGLTFSGASSTINLTDTTTSARAFTSGGLTYGTLNIGGTTGVSTTTVSGVNTFNTLASTKTVAHTISFAANQTITNWNVPSGTAGNVVTINSSAAGTGRSITYSGSQLNLDYMSFTDIIFPQGTNGAYNIYAGANSTNGGNISGIAFIDPTVKKAYLLTTGTTWTVPSDWNNSNNAIYLIGAGGSSSTSASSGNNRAGGGGGGGGGYTAITNYSATPLSTIPYTIGASTSNANGGDTGIGQNTISFVASTTLADTATSSTHVMNVPSGTANGDLMVLFIAASTTSTYNVPTGWTQAFNSISSCMICYRIASSEPASYTVTTSTLACTGYIATYRNAAFDAVGAVSVIATPSVAPSINVSYDNSIVLDFTVARFASTTFTTPTGFSSVASESNTTSPSSALFSDPVNAGATGTVSTTPSGGNTAFSILVALEPTPVYIAGGGKVGVSTTTPSSTGGAGGTGTTYNGGAGGAGSFGTVASAGHSGGGGGGAGGPNGVGGAGGNGFGNTVTTTLIAGGGGGGNGGGSAGGNASSGVQGNGGNNFGGTGGGTGSGTSGTFGGGGAGGVSGTVPGQGGSGVDIENTIGGGGGRGGVGYSTTTTTNTGLYGGGGGGGRVSTAGTTTTGAPGSQGVIFIVYAPGGTAYTASITEGSTFADVSDALQAVGVSVTEALGVADTSSVVAAFASAISENINVADASSVIAAFNSAVSEDLSVADIQTFVLTLNAAISEDILSIADSATGNLNFSTVVSEALTVTDIESVIAAFAAAISENTTIEDSATGVGLFSGIATEPITVEDAATGNATFIGVITEDTQIADTPSAVASFAAAIVEAAQFADINEVVLTINTDISEAITLADSQTVIANFASVVFENVGIAESESVVASFTAVISEGAVLEDAQAAIANFVSSLTEALTAADSSIAVRIQNSSITEDIQPADAQSALRTHNALITEDLIPADAITVIASFSSQITENLVLLDIPFPRGWFKINDDQTVSWGAVNNTNSAVWAAVNNGQTVTWNNVNNANSTTWTNIGDDQNPVWTSVDNTQ